VGTIAPTGTLFLPQGMSRSRIQAAGARSSRSVVHHGIIICTQGHREHMGVAMDDLTVITGAIVAAGVRTA
jgi:hypothetical protein